MWMVGTACEVTTEPSPRSSTSRTIKAAPPAAATSFAMSVNRFPRWHTIAKPSVLAGSSVPGAQPSASAGSASSSAASAASLTGNSAAPLMAPTGTVVSPKARSER